MGSQCGTIEDHEKINENWVFCPFWPSIKILSAVMKMAVEDIHARQD
jgi:hypothetical protein